MNYLTIKNEFKLVEENRTINQLENDYKMTDHEKNLHNGNWEWFNYISKGSIMKKFQNNFPKTFEILETIDNKMLGIPFSYCFFSKLSPGAQITPHYGPCNIRLRIHLGLDIPDSCYIKVAEEKRNWEEGKCLIFDDTYLHEVKNENKNNHRTILILDIWHPDIQIEEREAILKMFKGAYDRGWISETK